MYGGVRFGGTLPVDDAWEYGFDHVAIAAGAGRPTVIDMKNNLIRGIRKASDFLMALQLTGAFKRDALANLQVRLPAVVIGGGLTAIDTATELMAYYPVQVEKTLDHYEALAAEIARRGDIERIVPLVRQAVELGADVIKADPTDDPSQYHEVITIASGIPVLVRGGGKVADDELFRRTQAVLEQGAAGIVYGRNIIQHSNPVGMTRALMAMLHDGADATAAAAILAAS